MDAAWENRGPDNCDHCAVACFTSELAQQGDGDMLCAACNEARADERAEQAEEEASAAYYYEVAS